MFPLQTFGRVGGRQGDGVGAHAKLGFFETQIVLFHEVEIGDKAGEVETVIKPVHLLDLVKESIQAGETVVCVSLFEHPFEVAGLV